MGCVEIMVTERQKHVLRLLVDDYIRLASPIASESLVRNHDLGVSSATIRNDVAELEELGYITRPYASAGSVPLDTAYRLYVESHVPGDGSLPVEVQSAIRRQFVEIEQNVDEWATVAAELLAGLVGNMAVATFPKAKVSRIRRLELVHIQDLLLMLIVVLEQARLKRLVIKLTEPIEYNELETYTNKINANLAGRTRREIDSLQLDLTPLETEVVQATSAMLKAEERTARRDHYVDGLRNLLNQPEFVENDKMRELVGTVEDGSLIHAALEEAPEGNVVRVIIGQENQEDMLRPLSVVIGQYGIPGEAVGTVGAIGPTRMEYSRAISGVRFVSSVMSDLVETVHAV